MAEQQVPEWADPSVPEEALDAQGVSRRGLIRGAGLLGAGFAVAGVAGTTEAAAATSTAYGDPELVYLVGDHHVHSRYSHDAKYDFSQLAQRGAQFGLDWMAFSEHSNFGHADKGAQAENAEVLKARAENPRMLIFQGLEWYIPAAEHGTLMVAPGPNNVALIQQFEREYDGKLTNRAADTPENEQHALKALQWLAAQKKSGYIDDVLVLANHPLRLGIDAPHELRGWRDAAAGICIGMEGAPGSQGDADPAWVAFRGVTNAQRGEYVNNPGTGSFAGYPNDAYRTYGGFDWATATVGGLWDSMLAEGKLFSITSNSDNHRTIWDTWKDGEFPPGENFDSLGWKPSPTDAGTPQAGSDFWPGQFSRTHVGVTKYGYLEVMAGLRAGRVWVDHGQLVDGIDVRVAPAGSAHRGVTLGGRLRVNRSERLELRVTVTSATRPNFHGVLPRLAHLDVIRGVVTGTAPDKDSWRAPDTRVVEQVDVHSKTGTYTLRIPLGRAGRSHYLRLRGSDGRRNGPGYLGRHIDPAGPIQHPTNDGDPWLDTWLYTNPVFVEVMH